MSPVLEVKNLYKVFGETPQQAFPLLEKGLDKDQIFEQTGLTVGVKDVSLSINEGEIFVIMGLSGSGKSTLVRLLNRLIEPTQGSVLLKGKDIAHISEQELRDVRRKNISMVFQNFALMPHMTVLENAAFGLELSGVVAHERNKSAKEALARAGLDAYCESFPDELSGGMKQRVGLARALANDPDILLMDEAFSALDPLIRTEMQDELIRLQNDDKRTIVFISHDLDEAMRIGDRIAIMQDGIVVQTGTPDEILHHPANDYVSSFFRGVNVASVFSAKDIARKKPAAVFKKHDNDGPAAAMQLLMDHDRDYGIVVDRTNKYSGIVSLDSLKQALKQQTSLSAALLPDIVTVDPELSVSELISQVAEVPYAVPVVDQQGNYYGVITKSRLLQTLDRE
ncbi:MULTISPECIES: glycine betaine/L-proline ABC transporter ATP-binding protein ProV [unclassified Vibrio]|uniref:glycine betaine/L-proline ABC transporter ATP-binding protein ProV n=1 Tax=unclassified Vibrio TaxID=2614977 RepID=UPI000B8E4CCD|nr:MULTISPECIES: glycine betaine/L-proline ABC transporter ATP-binding protein ProV [unclassified Vibrio]NAX43235.1 glycine betaine/L-proline ABC transporter ATP-binding protein ProV [Vibrio sp. V25_P4S6T154]OXX47989.1 glycine betaine/L-proline ABC transporter ATP-binding protein [Vibrio sp. V17_P4S1T151]OXX61035.1 glycine betaine/L-proline ABC transporter ATP-binding protein [Vibrio sp. V15_P4S5T153]OXX63441.1 glycine betaine/L-proline ABC transporter ATP-binding protein [Vibrio sp. V20_P4S3T1